MSYTPENQKIHHHVESIIDGIDNLCGAIRERVDHPDNWGDDHLQDIADMSIDLQRMRFRLKRFQSGKKWQNKDT